MTAKPPQPPQAAAAPSINALHDTEVVAQLRSGENAAMLSAYFGETEYRELRKLAQLAAKRRVRGGPRVLILPGIMGSKIGKPGRLRDDVLWLDPIEVMAGKLLDLALPKGRNLKAVGVMLFGYLKLKLQLQIAGFDASFHAYDWRQSIDTLGHELATRIRKERSRSVMLVAHSMGGLVARAALQTASTHITRLIELGSPNYGSFAPVQALRATYPTVRKIAALDLHHSPEQLAEKVFRTLPGLYQMLPAPERSGHIDFFDPKSWPRDVLAPDAKLLEQSRLVQASLAPADERCCLIIGVNQETVTDARPRAGGFEYTITLDGDGTVPRSLAEWPKARTWFAEESHGGLTNNSTVGATVIDLLKTGDTTRLPTARSRKRHVVVGKVGDAMLRRRVAGKVRWNELSLEARRKILESVISPEFHGHASAPAVQPAPQSQPRLIDSRHRRRTIEIRLACGSITEAEAQALVLGVFRGVEPGGAADAIDQRLKGALKEFTLRRMFSGNRGEVFVLPAGRSQLAADMVLLAGLGDFDRFDAAAQQFVAENVVRTFLRTRVDDFATVLLGAGSGVSIETALANQIGGYFRALKENDGEHRMRRITLVEYDRSKCDAIKQALDTLSSTSLFDDIDVLFETVELPTVTAAVGDADSKRRRADQRFAYLIVAQDGASPSQLNLRASVLTSGAKAAVLTGTKTVPKRKLEQHLKRIAHADFTVRRLPAYGRELAGLLLHGDVLAALATVQSHHLVIVHDEAAAGYPWETLFVDGRFPAAGAGLSRRYAAEKLSVARWREVRRQDAALDVLLVVNPTGDLEGATAEGERLQELLGRDKRVRIVEVRGADATRERLLDEFRSGRYDVLHYAGHAFFDAEQSGRSGILCADGKVLSGADLANVAELPALAFFNACEAGRIRSGNRFSEAARLRLRRNVSLAEAFLRGGVANYVGTYWPVGDTEASRFALTFYRALVKGESVGKALSAARGAVLKLKSVDWADYIHYGSYDFTLKKRESGAAEPPSGGGK